MKGFADIVLYDKDGNIVKEQHDNNFITDAFKEYLELHNAIISNPCSKIGDDVRDVTSGMTLQKLIGGIVLFGDKLPEDPKIIHNKAISLASAGTAYDYTNPLRGSLNSQETGATEIDGKQAYRWVWDFGTANANCTFNTVCLSTKYAGDRNYKPTVGIDYFNMENKLRTHNHTVYRFLNNNNYGITFDKKGRRITRKEDFISIEDYSKSKKITDTGAMLEDIKISPSTHQWFSSTTHLEGDILTFIAKNISSTQFELVSIDINTTAIVNTIELTGLKDSITSRIDSFGFCGNKTIVFNPTVSSGKVVLSFFNLETKEKTINFQTNEDISYSSFNGIYMCSFKTVDGEYGCTITIGTRNNYCNFAYYMVYNKNTVKTLMNEPSNSNGSMGSAYPTNRSFNNMNLSGIVTINYNEAYGGMTWVPGMEPLFTINNLQNPITKTEANTMKITYTLVFE